MSRPSLPLLLILACCLYLAPLAWCLVRTVLGRRVTLLMVRRTRSLHAISGQKHGYNWRWQCQAVEQIFYANKILPLQAQGGSTP